MEGKGQREGKGEEEGKERGRGKGGRPPFRKFLDLSLSV